MPTKPKNEWNIGKTVNVGFLTGFLVVDQIPNPDRYDPKIWVLEKNGREYWFVPHKGLMLADAHAPGRLHYAGGGI